METIGARIKLAREHHGLRGIEVTRKLGWKRQATIFDLEASSGGISTKHLASLAELLDVSIDWLVTDKPEHAPAWLDAGRSITEGDDADVSPPPAGTEAA